MSEVKYLYIVHSDVDENNVYAEFWKEEEAIEYAKNHIEDQTFVNKVEVEVDSETGDIIEEYGSETVWVWEWDTESEDAIDLEVEEEDSENPFVSDFEKPSEEARYLIDFNELEEADADADSDELDTLDELDYDSMLEELEENESLVECQVCFELVDKDNCVKSEDGHYRCKSCAECKEQECLNEEESLNEVTHAQVAKPAGDKVKAYNNALTYAKKFNKPYIYGYTNHTGKFFALDYPAKVVGEPAEAEKAFRSKYKNCSVLYVAYPDKDFLTEASFTKEEQEEYNIDADGVSLDSYDEYVRCSWCGEPFIRSECRFEANLGWLCDRCYEELKSHGGSLAIIEDPTEEDIAEVEEN